jgi:predicted MFS family arabinose efflux permease
MIAPDLGAIMAHNRSFRRLLAALAVSQLGDWLYNVALLAFVFDRTHSATWLGATTAARVLPIVLLGPLAGILGDRFDRRLVMVLSDTARAVAMLALVAVAVYGLPIWLVPALAGLATAAASPYPACVAASVPRLVPREQLPAANALRSAIGPLAVVAGPAIGAVLLAVAGVAWAFAANAVTFVASAVLVLAVPQRDAFRPTGSAGREPGVWAAVTVGARELLRRPGASRLIGADVLCSLCYGVQTVLLVTVSIRLGWHDSGYGLLLGAIGAGGFVGTALAPRALRALGSQHAPALALLTVGVCLPLLAIVPSYPVVLLAAAACGAGSLLVEVGAETVLQEQLPDEVFARAYGFAFPASIGGIALGSLVAAPLVMALGITGAFAAVGVLVCGYALWLGIARHRLAAIAGAATTVLSALALTGSLTLAAPAHAADTITHPTLSFTTAGTYYVTVPAYTQSVSIDGLGGAGFPGDDASSGVSKGGAGGSGTHVHVAVEVSGGDQLQVAVGAKGGGGQRGYGSELSGSGGNGGGATIITDITSGNLLLVAGGGGGGGGGSGLYFGYAGGSGGTNGDGTPGIGTFGQDAGRGGSLGQIGNCGLSATVTQGEAGESAPTGSGVGGGGGGGQGACAGGGQSGGSGEHAAGEGGGGGGGAGASYADAFGTDQQYSAGSNSGDGSASLTFTTYVPHQPVITSSPCIYTGDLTESKYLPQVTATGYPAPAIDLIGAPGWLTIYGAGYDVDGSSSINLHADGPVAPGQYRLQVKATNAVGSLIDPLTLVVGPTQPEFLSPDTATATAGSSFAFQVQAVGCPPFTQYAITAGQSDVPWLTIDPETGELSGLPDASDVGTHTITVQASTGGAIGAPITQTLTVQVNPAAVTPPPVTVPPVTTPPITTPPATVPPATPPATSGSSGATPPEPASKLAADLAVHLGGPATVRTGRTFTETLTVTNHGPHRAGRVHLALRVPRGFAVSDAAGATRHGRALRWSIPALAAHGTHTYTLTFEVVTQRRAHHTFRAAVRSLTARDLNAHNDHGKDRLLVKPQ